jgi:hypothetical protein
MPLACVLSLWAFGLQTIATLCHGAVAFAEYMPHIIVDGFNKWWMVQCCLSKNWNKVRQKMSELGLSQDCQLDPCATELYNSYWVSEATNIRISQYLPWRLSSWDYGFGNTLLSEKPIWRIQGSRKSGWCSCSTACHTSSENWPRDRHISTDNHHLPATSTS